MSEIFFLHFFVPLWIQVKSYRPRFRYRVVARSGYDVTVKPDRIKSCVTGILAFMVNARWNPENASKVFRVDFKEIL